MCRFAYAALVCAVGVSLSQSIDTAFAQEAATAGGDVTADEATPLPPVLIQSPAEPVGQPRRKAPAQKSGNGAGAVAGEGAPSEAPALAGNGEGAVGVFTLGQLDLIGGSTITNEAMWTYNKNTLDQALSIIPGITMQNTGGSRNERDIFVRGFDRYRVPLSLDGVRIYLPADNRLDFNRFLTPDLSEVQVQKGYVSVLNGPGGMGGAINMVSRKPTKAVEAEGRVGANFNGDLDDLNSWNSYAYAGTRQEHYYAQLSGNILDQDHWNLSDDFDPVFLPNEDGGARDHSDARDWRINAKVGFTPNATDEYSINYTTQSGEKSAPLHVEGQAVQGPRYWDWPYWDISSVSWLSKTQIGSASYVKTNVYYNTFENLLSSFDDATYGPQFMGRSFESYYDDYAVGGFFEAGTELIPMNTLKGVVHYRRDNHSEYQITQPDNPASIREPRQENVEDTWSFAVENTFHATRRLDFVTGVSYDMNIPRVAEDFTNGVIIENDTPSSSAWNGQAAAIYRYSGSGEVHATVSDRTRFPTVFERFSTRFGFAVPNPDLEPERTINYEIGASDTFFNTVQVSSAIFYADLQDSIQPVYVSNRAIQNQNITGNHQGIEISVDWDITKTLRLGGNYTYLERSYDYLTPGAKPEGTPMHEGFIYLAWRPTPSITITPNIELASDRNSLITSNESTLLSNPPIPNYVATGAYALVNFQAEYRFDDNWTAAIGGTNLTDEDYALSQGFPEPGRTFFANMRARF